jgi:hypothetical protein
MYLTRILATIVLQSTQLFRDSSGSVTTLGRRVATAPLRTAVEFARLSSSDPAPSVLPHGLDRPGNGLIRRVFDPRMAPNRPRLRGAVRCCIVAAIPESLRPPGGAKRGLYRLPDPSVHPFPVRPDTPVEFSRADSGRRQAVCQVRGRPYGWFFRKTILLASFPTSTTFRPTTKTNPCLSARLQPAATSVVGGSLLHRQVMFRCVSV